MGTFNAWTACSVPDDGFNANTVPNFKVVDIFANFLDRATEFVAEGKWDGLSCKRVCGYTC